VIDVRHEQTAAHAADGWARVTGRPGVAVVTAGPGLTDAVTGVASAHRANVPMIIIGGLGSVMGTLMGTAFMVLLPESMEWLSVALRGSPIDQVLGLKNNIAFLREMAIGIIIIVFLVFETECGHFLLHHFLQNAFLQYRKVYRRNDGCIRIQ
jgi:hypothetical protein